MAQPVPLPNARYPENVGRPWGRARASARGRDGGGHSGPHATSPPRPRRARRACRTGRARGARRASHQAGQAPKGGRGQAAGQGRERAGTRRHAAPAPRCCPCPRPCLPAAAASRRLLAARGPAGCSSSGLWALAPPGRLGARQARRHTRLERGTSIWGSGAAAPAFQGGACPSRLLGRAAAAQSLHANRLSPLAAAPGFPPTAAVAHQHRAGPSRSPAAGVRRRTAHARGTAGPRSSPLGPISWPRRHTIGWV
jgi:hypothetical protein